MMNRILERHYYNLNYPESFTTKTALERRFKGEIEKNDVDEWTQAQKTITEYAPARKNFLRRPTVAHKRDSVWAADTAFFISLAKYNRGYKYLVIIVDVLSKFVRAVPLKTKKPAELLQGMKKIFKTAKPSIFYVDMGTEFSSHFSKYLKENNIQLWRAHNETKSSVAERYIQTYKLRVYRYMHYNNTKKWIDVYEKILNNMNNSYNYAIKMKPVDCVSLEQQRRAFINLYGTKIGFTPKEDGLEDGQQVKISNLRIPFRKAFLRNFSELPYTLIQKYPKENQTVYTLKANDGEIIKGKFYRKEFKKTKDENIRKIL
jgi:transposase InsO family protein